MSFKPKPQVYSLLFILLRLQVYYRSAYTPKDYPTEREWSGRLLIERSFAIKCPSIMYHLSGAKKIQQVLAAKGEVERFVAPDEALRLRASFAGLWELGENMSPEAALAVEGALTSPDNYVIKPQREGGGNNIYGADVRHALLTMPPKELNAYILMQRIFPAKKESALLRNGEVISGSTVSELGIYSTYLSDGTKVLLDRQVGHLLRTKLDGVNEGGVASGFAVLDSPLLLKA
jgi:glutathione synthetase